MHSNPNGTQYLELQKALRTLLYRFLSSIKPGEFVEGSQDDRYYIVMRPFGLQNSEDQENWEALQCTQYLNDIQYNNLCAALRKLGYSRLQRNKGFSGDTGLV